MPYSDWTQAERAAWTPPENLSVADWAAKYFVVPEGAMPGPWRHSNAPVSVGLMELFGDPAIEELNFQKSAQGGISTIAHVFIGRQAHLEPDPMLLVFPDEAAGKRAFAKRIQPVFETTPELAALLPQSEVKRNRLSGSRKRGSVTIRNIYLENGFRLNLGWSGSPASLASDPMRFVINDEVDKFQQSEKEADPISLAEVRTRTYAGRKQIINISTPTTPEGWIHQRYSACPVKLSFLAPCPKCREYQPLVFSQVRWPKFPDLSHQQHADRVQSERLARYECIACKAELDDDERTDMLRDGRWLWPGQTIEKDGTVTGDKPRIRLRVGIHIWAIHAPWVSMSQIAAEFIKAADDHEAMKTFVTQTLGEPYQRQLVRMDSDVFAEKCEGASPAGVVPDWAMLLIAGVDTQKNHFYFVVRAFGPGMRSQRVDHGMVASFDELRQRIVEAEYPIAGSTDMMPVHRVAIDSGGGRGDGEDELAPSRTDEVYRFALSERVRVQAVKGASGRKLKDFSLSRVTYRPRDESRPAYEVVIALIDTSYYKDILSTRINQTLKEGDEEVDVWGLNDRNDAEYNRQMSAEHRVSVRKGKGRFFDTWQLKGRGMANHYWDAEVYALALATSLSGMRGPRKSAQPKAPRVNRIEGQENTRPPIRRSYD